MTDTGRQSAVTNVVNLNKARKRKAKADALKRADVNRRLHGRTKLERAREELQTQHLTAKLDGARLERAPDDVVPLASPEDDPTAER